MLETLRLDQSEHLNRRVLRSFEFEGFHFPKDAWVSILTRETHRNAHAFPDPDAFRPERFLGRRPTADEYSPFGIGAPKGTPDAVVKRLHDAFKQAMEQDSYKTALARYDMVPMYMSTSAYKKFAQDTFTREKALVEKLGLAKPT